MDVRDYISSGIIELYSMNALSPQEMKEVERMAIAHPEVAKEIDHVRMSLEDYASAHARNPRPSLRTEIMKSVSESKESKKGKVIGMQLSPTGSYKFLVAACIVLIVISTAIIYSLFNKWQDAENKYVALQNEKNKMANSYELVKNAYDKTFADLTVIRNENARIITLLATDQTKNYMARVYWNSQTHNAFIDVLSLPAPAADKQYQLWALVGGKPVDAGIFNMDATSGMQQLKTVISADAWAVTLEPKGGSSSPTLTQMYLLSKS